jgi:hypothetical protein
MKRETLSIAGLFTIFGIIFIQVSRVTGFAIEVQ